MMVVFVTDTPKRRILTKSDDPRIPEGVEIAIGVDGRVLDCSDPGAFAQYTDSLEIWEREILQTGRVFSRERIQ